MYGGSPVLRDALVDVCASDLGEDRGSARDDCSHKRRDEGGGRQQERERGEGANEEEEGHSSSNVLAQQEKRTLLRGQTLSIRKREKGLWSWGNAKGAMQGSGTITGVLCSMQKKTKEISTRRNLEPISWDRRPVRRRTANGEEMCVCVGGG